MMRFFGAGGPALPVVGVTAGGAPAPKPRRLSVRRGRAVPPVCKCGGERSLVRFPAFFRAASLWGGVIPYRPARVARKRANVAPASLGWLAVSSPNLARPACGSAARVGSFGGGGA